MFLRIEEQEFIARYEVVYTHFPEKLCSEEYSKTRGLPHGLDVLQSDAYTITKKPLHVSRHSILAATVCTYTILVKAHPFSHLLFCCSHFDFITAQC